MKHSCKCFKTATKTLPQHCKVFALTYFALNWIPLIHNGLLCECGSGWYRGMSCCSLFPQLSLLIQNSSSSQRIQVKKEPGQQRQWLTPPRSPKTWNTGKSQGEENQEFGTTGTSLTLTSTYWLTPQNKAQVIEQIKYCHPHAGATHHMLLVPCRLCITALTHNTPDTPEAELAAKAHHRSNEHIQVMGSALCSESYTFQPKILQAGIWVSDPCQSLIWIHSNKGLSSPTMKWVWRSPHFRIPKLQALILWLHCFAAQVLCWRDSLQPRVRHAGRAALESRTT